jgi:hypothetical protein
MHVKDLSRPEKHIYDECPKAGSSIRLRRESRNALSERTAFLELPYLNLIYGGISVGLLRK